jgi:hypothetical protein
MHSLAKIYLIFLFVLLNMCNVQSLKASPIKNLSKINISQPQVTSPFNYLKDLRSSAVDSKLSVLSYRPNQNESKTLLYFSFIFFFFILIIIKLSSPEYFSDLFSSLFKKNYLFSSISKSKFNISLNSLFLDFIFAAVLSYFFYQYLYSRYQTEYYIIFAGLVIFTSIQMLIIIIAYNLFFGSENVNIHLTNLLISNRIIGIIFTPLLFIITYTNSVFQSYGLNILMGIFIIIILIRIYRILNQLKIIYNFSFLFILLYICTFELSFYFVCFKAVLLFINS